MFRNAAARNDAAEHLTGSDSRPFFSGAECES